MGPLNREAVLRAALKRIIRKANSQYDPAAPASSDLCDEIAAIAEDALKEAKK